MQVTMKNGQISINGQLVSGKNVSISGKKVTIDGVVQGTDLSGDVHVVIHGDVDQLTNESGTVTAQNVGDISTLSGDVRCNDVSGSINTMSGDVTCGHVAGSIKTMSGDVSHR